MYVWWRREAALYLAQLHENIFVVLIHGAYMNRISFFNIRKQISVLSLIAVCAVLWL